MKEDKGFWKRLFSTIINIPRGFKEFIIANLFVLALIMIGSYLNLQYPWSFELLSFGAVVVILILIHAAYSAKKGN